MKDTCANCGKDNPQYINDVGKFCHHICETSYKGRYPKASASPSIRHTLTNTPAEECNPCFNKQHTDCNNKLHTSNYIQCCCGIHRKL